MNPVELKFARMRRRKSATDMGRVINRTSAAWNNRERGEVDISVQESAEISRDLDLSEKEFFDIFYDGKFPFRKNE